MTRLIALMASFAVNALLLGALDYSAFLASLPPEGLVSVTELPSHADMQTYAALIAAAAQ